jgi:hypothetical protein
VRVVVPAEAAEAAAVAEASQVEVRPAAVVRPAKARAVAVRVARRVAVRPAAT